MTDNTGDTTAAAAIEKAREALQKLYDYTCELECASAAWFATRRYAKQPEGGAEAGELAREALAALDAAAEAKR